MWSLEIGRCGGLALRYLIFLHPIWSILVSLSIDRLETLVLHPTSISRPTRPSCSIGVIQTCWCACGPELSLRGERDAIARVPQSRFFFFRSRPFPSLDWQCPHILVQRAPCPRCSRWSPPARAVSFLLGHSETPFRNESGMKRSRPLGERIGGCSVQGGFP